MKKLAGLAAAGALLLNVAGVAFASHFDTVVKNKAKVKVFTVAVANTGFNSVNAGDDVKGGKVKTGDALAVSDVSNVVNTTTVDNCDCEGSTLVKNKAKVKVAAISLANTGFNSVNADDVKGGRVVTGNGEAGSVVTNVVNTTVVGSDTTE